MHGRLRTRLLKGFAANSFGQFVTAGIQLVSVPVFLYSWGAPLYGEWLVLSSIPAYLAMSDIGFASVAGNQMAMQFGRGDEQGALQTFQSTWVFICLVSLVIAGAAAAAFGFFPIARWLHLTMLSNKVFPVAGVLTAYVLVGLQSAVVGAGFRSSGDYAVGSFYMSLARLSEFGAVALAVTLGGSPFHAALVFLVVRMLVTIAMARQLTKSHRWLFFGLSHARWETIKHLSRPAVAFMAFPLGNVLSLQGMLTMVGMVLGPVAAVTFSTCRTLTRIGLQGTGVINNAVWPEISLAYGAKNTALVRKLHRAGSRAAVWLMFVTIPVLAVTGPSVFRIWTRSRVPLDATMFYWLLLVAGVAAFWQTSSIVLIGANAHQRMAIIYLIGTVSSLLLAYLIIPWAGVAGAAVSLLAIDFAMASYVVNRALLLTKDVFFEFAAEMLRVPRLTRSLGF